VRFDASGELGAIPYAANFGIRYVDTRLTTRTNRRVVAGTVTSFTPQTDRNEDTDWLPSMNLSFDLTQKLKLRFAAAKALARPNLPDLAPSVFVNQPGRAVSGGNAALESIKLDEYGAALEYYFGAGNIASATLFYKDVKGLIAPLTVVEIFPGFEFLGPVPITRPINTNNAVIKGIEVGYQQALDFLPDPLKGFGVIANLTYADGSTGTDEPIINLSEVSYNLIGYYERGGFSTRLAYNYRSRRAVSFTGADRRPDFIAPTSQLDASMSYNLNDNVSINFGAVNLIPSKSDVTSYNVVRNAVNAYELNERQFYLSLRARY
jgi:iron complex outermembrane recepter protein